MQPSTKLDVFPPGGLNAFTVTPLNLFEVRDANKRSLGKFGIASDWLGHTQYVNLEHPQASFVLGPDGRVTSMSRDFAGELVPSPAG